MIPGSAVPQGLRAENRPRVYSRRIKIATIPAAFGLGALVSVQSKINGTLAHQLGTGIRAGALSAVISFGTGLILILAVVLTHRASRRGVARLYRGLARGEVPWWLILGGLAGAMVVASQGLTVGTLGVALFIVAVVAGQSSAGLAVDHRGLGPGGPRLVSRGRIIGAALAVVAVGLSTIGSHGLALTAGLLLALLPLAAGAANSVQQAFNGRVAVYTNAWAATFNNFVVGLTGLLIFLGISLLLPGELGGPPQQWWLYLGGPIGVAFIWTTSILVRIHGVLILGLCSTAGQVSSAIAIDLITEPDQLTGFSYLAAAITLAGVAIATLLRPRSTGG